MHEGQCAICDDRFRVTRSGRIHRHLRRGQPCEGVEWPPIARACLLPRPPTK